MPSQAEKKGGGVLQDVQGVYNLTIIYYQRPFDAFCTAAFPVLLTLYSYVRDFLLQSFTG